MQAKSIDGILPVPDHVKNHRHIRKFFKNLPTRAVVEKDRVILLEYNRQDPCKSVILVEYFNDQKQESYTLLQSLSAIDALKNYLRLLKYRARVGIQ